MKFSTVSEGSLICWLLEAACTPPPTPAPAALYDFDAYRQAFENVLASYMDEPSWIRKAILNTASAGYFSVDRTIDEYNRIIWGLDSI